MDQSTTAADPIACYALSLQQIVSMHETDLPRWSAMPVDDWYMVQAGLGFALYNTL